jgi:hypothetical protein
MAIKGEVKDLTKRSGKLTAVSASGIELDAATMPDPFLSEAWVGNSMKCCYFSHNFTISKVASEYDFEIGLIRIPEGFQFVEYCADGNAVPNWANKKAPITKTIYSHILMNIRQPNSGISKAFHICENEATDGQTGETLNLHDKTPQGCSHSLRSAYDPQYPFLLFYYSGQIYFSDSDLTTKEVTELPTKGWYLVPFALSERIIVYYVIPEDVSGGDEHLEKLDLLYKNLPSYYNKETGEYPVGLTERLQLNDKLGIFVTRSILGLP